MLGSCICPVTKALLFAHSSMAVESNGNSMLSSFIFHDLASTGFPVHTLSLQKMLVPA